MDVWIVAAAAGAGYIAQHWKSLIKGKESLSDSSFGCSSFAKTKSSQPQDKPCPLSRLLQGKKIGEDVSIERELVSQSSSDAFDVEKLVIPGNYEDCNVLSLSSLSVGFLSSEDVQENQAGFRVNGNVDENLGDFSLTPSKGDIISSARNRSILRTRRTNGQFIKPLSSLESCLMAQLYKEHAEMEEYIYSSLPSPSTSKVRPFVVTNGSRIISRSSGVKMGTWEDKETHSEENETVIGIPPLRNVRPIEIRRKTKAKKGKEWNGRLSSSSKLVNGSSHGAVFFCLGISVGIISSLLANNREADKLKMLLKQTESLVQDLHEELEMKDSLTVKEIAVEDYESQDTHNESFNEQNLGESTKDDHKEFCDQKAEEESFSKIEAELEAELQRLEVNMNSSSLEGKLSGLVELDPDFVPDIVQAESRADIFGGAQPYLDRDGSSGSTPHSANYAVSPRELSLRLHELLQARLEERVKELETALENSQRQVQYKETEHMNHEFSNSEAESSPVAAIERNSRTDVPVVINLSGEALDAYNEMYDEFAKNESEEEDDLSSGVEKNNYDDRESFRRFGRSLYGVEDGEVNSPVTLIHENGEDSDEISSDQDEKERLLIKQIVEKARKGSPVVLNAQKAWFSVDENEH